MSRLEKTQASWALPGVRTCDAPLHVQYQVPYAQAQRQREASKRWTLGADRVSLSRQASSLAGRQAPEPEPAPAESRDPRVASVLSRPVASQ